MSFTKDFCRKYYDTLESIHHWTVLGSLIDPKNEKFNFLLFDTRSVLGKILIDIGVGMGKYDIKNRIDVDYNKACVKLTEISDYILNKIYIGEYNEEEIKSMYDICGNIIKAKQKLNKINEIINKE